MKQRGLRLEVDEPSERQLRNSAWLASHPVVCAAVGAIIVATLGWLAVRSAPVAVSLPVGAVAGAVAGWALSVESSRETPRGPTLVLYVAALVVLGVGLLVVRVVT